MLYVLNAGGAGNISGFVAKRNGLTHHVGTFRVAHDGSLALVGTFGNLPAGTVGLAAD